MPDELAVVGDDVEPGVLGRTLVRTKNAMAVTIVPTMKPLRRASERWAALAAGDR